MLILMTAASIAVMDATPVKVVTNIRYVSGAAYPNDLQLDP
jgi:hypothetical protein